MSIKKTLQEYLELKPLIYIAILLLGLGYLGRDYVEDIQSNITNDTIKAIQPQLEKLQQSVEDRNKAVYNAAYKGIKWDLIKQLEKLATDPSDIKFTDIQKFSDYCTKDAYFRNIYIPEQSDSRALELGCLKVEAIYDERYNSVFGGGK